MSVSRRVAGVVVLGLVGGLVFGMGLSSASTRRGANKPVKVKLFEFKVKPKPKSAAAGKVKFVVKNIGAEEHEMVVALSDGTATELPTDADGAVDESQIPEADLPGEIPEFAAGKTKTKTFDLEPGTYVLFCNIVDDEADGTKLSHYAQGMHTLFTVN